MSWFNWKDVLWIAAMAFTVGVTHALGEDVYYWMTGLVDICRG